MWHNRLVLPLSMLVYILVGLWIARDSLGYYWNEDDLHLIRRFSAAELREVWQGPWDPDQIETPGWRPLTTWFNHSRAVVFGESPRAHRMFLIVLFAGYLTSLSRLVVRLGAPWWVGTLAGLLTLCAKYSYFHFVWIADGIHLFCGVLFIAAAHLFLSDVERPAFWKLGAGLVCAAAALLAREESIALFPVLLVLSACHAFQQHRLAESIDRIWLSGKILCAGAVGILLYGRFVVPLGPWPHGLRGLIEHASSTISLGGAGSLKTPAAILFFVAVVVAAIVRLSRHEQISAAVWLFCAFIACTPGIITTRVNLLLFPTSFFCVFVVLVLARLFRPSLHAAVFATAFVLAIGIAAIEDSRIQQQSLHPMSLEQLERDWGVVYGMCAKCEIPAERLEHLQSQLSAQGVTRTPPDWSRWEAELRDKGRLGMNPAQQDRVFVPQQSFMEP